MSSLRLALKQSLQETASGLSGDDDVVSGKKKRKKSRKSMMIREQRRGGDGAADGDDDDEGRQSKTKKRGPGRPRKYPRPDDMESGETPPKKRGPGRPRKSSRRDDDDNDDHDEDDAHSDDDHDHHDHHGRRRYDGGPGGDDGHDDHDDDGHSSSENEFSSSSGEEEDGDGSDDGSDDEEEDDDEGEDEDGSDEEEEDDDDDDEKSSNTPKPSSFDTPYQRSSNDQDQQSLSGRGGGEDREDARHKSRDGDVTEEELRRKRKLLKKKLKHSAANKIQNQWKKKKDGGAADREDGASVSQEGGDTADAAPKKKTSSPPHGKKSESTEGADEKAPVKKKAKKKKNNGVVPRPSHEVMEWAHNMSEKKCRKHIASGMRVKVRFAVPVKRDGQTVKKKIWYGGRVTAVSKMGSKIRIKYDDGTSEVSQFPDADIVVDNEDNGEHSVSADRFLPPSLRQREEDHHASLTTAESFAAADDVVAMEVEAVSAPSRRREEHDEHKKTHSKSTTPAVLDKVTKQVQEKEIEVPESTEAQSNDPATPESRPSHGETAGHKRREPTTMQKSFGSPEEGELSPGMTIKKDEPQELSSTVSVPMDIGTDSETKKSTVVTATGSEQSKQTKPSQNDPPKSIMEQDTKKDSLDQPFGSLSEPKLEVPVPSDTLKKIPLPQPSPPEEEAKQSTADDVLSDTPIAGDIHKRKRCVVEGENETEEPPKRKIKVSIPKSPRPTTEKLKGDNESGRKDDKSDSAPDTKRIKLKVIQPAAAREKGSGGKETSKPTEKKPEVGSPRSLDEDPKAITIQEHASQTSKPADVGETKEPVGTQPIEEPLAVEKSLKKKVKKKEGSKIQRSKSPTPNRSTSPIPVAKKDAKGGELLSSETSQDKTVDGMKGVGPTQSGGSAPDDQIKNQPLLTGSRSNESINYIAARGGRKAAMEAMEKMTTSKDRKEKDPSAEQGHKKKKRKRKEDTEGADETQDWVNEMEWVQCDSCSKWRVLPSNVKVSDLPNKWYCHLNVYDPDRINCDAPEQTAKQALKELKRAKKRAKRLEQLEAEKAVNQNEAEKETGKKQAVTMPNPTVSPKQPAKPIVKTTAKSKEGIESKAEDQSDAGSEDNKGEKKKRGKKGKIIQQQQQQQQQQQEQQQQQQQQKEPETTEGQADSTAPVGDQPKKKRPRGRPPRSTTSSSSQDNRDTDNVEWVQCEKCSKWRKLPADLSADELPDVWVCSMNSWNTAVASCKASEETTDAQHQEVGTSEWQLRQAHAGKYSYRTMIFGTGTKKHNRPMSERSRAAESLFQSPDDDERPYPICMYSKSSMFLPRTSNFHKSQMAEDKSTGIFDVLSDSNAFNELREANLVSSGFGQKFDAYESLDKEKRNAMSDLVLDIIGDDALTGDQIIAVANATRLGEMSRYCNTDIIINTLLAIVKDGVLEMSCVDPTIPMQEWTPQFRRTRTRRACQIVDTIKRSSCLKISKPWKNKPGTF